jgi:hypothetical protein
VFVEDGLHSESFKILPDRLVAREAGMTYFLSGSTFHLYRFTTKGSQFKVYVDENPTPVMIGPLVTTTTDNRVMFGSGASAGTQDVYFDYVRYSVAGDLPPGQGDPGGPVFVQVLLEPGAANGVDRATLRVSNLPFNQYSSTFNKVRFSMADLAGNVGWSPIYTVRTGMVDTDGDGIDDSWERAFFNDLSRDGTGDFDLDGQSDFDEFVAGTHPRDPGDSFRILTYTKTNQASRLTWTSLPGKNYHVQASPNLSNPAWSNLTTASLVATSAVTEWTGTPPAGRNYFRIHVLRP